MLEVQTFEDKAALEAFLKAIGEELVEVKAYGGIDTRIGWDTYIVIARYTDGTTGPVGFTNGPVE